MAYIGFLLIMVGLAAAGGAIDRGDDLLSAVILTVIGAALMWRYREEDKDGEEEDNGPDPGGGAAVDKPAGEGTGGHGKDQARGRRADDQDADHGVPSRRDHGVGTAYQARHLCGTQGVDREDRPGVEMRKL